MSAFICSDSHISTIANAIYPGNKSMAQLLADKLKSINIDSVNCRYNEKTPKRKCKFSIVENLTNDDIAKLIACWDYQACEKPADIDLHAYRALLNNWSKSNNTTWENGRFWSI